MGNFLAVGLKNGAFHIFMEFCPEESSRKDCGGLRQALVGRYASVTRQEEAYTMLMRLDVEPSRWNHPNEPGSLAVLIVVIEQSDPIVLPLHS